MSMRAKTVEGSGLGTLNITPPSSGDLLGLSGREQVGSRQPLKLWNLTKDIPGHPKGSSMSRRTLETTGFASRPRRKNRLILDV